LDGIVRLRVSVTREPAIHLSVGMAPPAGVPSDCACHWKSGPVAKTLTA
jgi:hypothetical protein